MENKIVSQNMQDQGEENIDLYASAGYFVRTDVRAGGPGGSNPFGNTGCPKTYMEYGYDKPGGKDCYKAC